MRSGTPSLAFSVASVIFGISPHFVYLQRAQNKMSGPFEIGVGTIARLISCSNCQADYGQSDEFCGGCAHKKLNHKLVRVVEQYEHEDPAMETPCFIVSSLDGEIHIEGIRMWELERPNPLEELASQAE